MPLASGCAKGRVHFAFMTPALEAERRGCDLGHLEIVTFSTLLAIGRGLEFMPWTHV